MPTCHPDFLQVLTYCKVADVNHSVAQDATFGGSAMADGKSNVPVMVIDNTSVAGVDEILQRLKNEGKDLDRNLSARERAETLAFTSMLQGPLRTAMECEWYLNETNWEEVVRPLYTTGSFPGNWILPGQVHKRVLGRIGFYRDEPQRKALFRSAADCYAALSARLGEGAYFYGDQPCSLDVAAFSHLAMQLYAPMVEAKMSTMLRQHPNLQTFVTRFRSKHLGLGGATKHQLPALLEPEEDAAAKGKAGSSLTPAEKDRRRKAKDFMALGAILTLAFCLFTNVIDVDSDALNGVEA